MSEALDTKDDKIFSYVIAAKWPLSDGLCIYTYGSEIQTGDIESAKGMLDYVRRTKSKEGKRYSWEPKTEDFFIHKITYEILNID